MYKSISGENTIYDSVVNEIDANGYYLKSCSNVGTGTGEVFRNTSTQDSKFKTIKSAGNILIINNTDDVTISQTVAPVLTASNLGTGSGVYASKSANDIRFKSLVAGSNVTLTPATNDITIAASGEANTASNVGTGAGNVYKAKSGVDLQLKTINAGSNITVTNNTNDITIAMPGPVYLADGSVSAPAHSFTNDSQMGMYRVSSGILGFGCLGFEMMRLNQLTNTMTPSVQITNSMQPAVIYTATSNQTVANNTLTRVAWQSSVLNQGGCFTFLSNQFTLASDTKFNGWYLITYQVSWDGGVAGSYREGYLYLNGSKLHRTRTIIPSIAAGVGTTNVSSSVAQLVASDVLSLQVQQNSGGNLDILNTSNNAFISFTKLF